MIGRRVGAIGELERPGDYCGPIPDTAWAGGNATDERPKVWFLLPCARDADVEPGLRSIMCVASPPHVFRECADGSLEVRESIAVYNRAGDAHAWHGYLYEGHDWRTL